RRVRALGADALAMGEHVAFAPAAYRPGRLDGDRLLAHELVHVIQQRRHPAAGAHDRLAVDRSVAPEQQADALAGAVSARLQAPASAMARPAIRPGSAQPAVRLGKNEKGTSGTGKETDPEVTPEELEEFVKHYRTSRYYKAVKESQLPAIQKEGLDPLKGKND